MLFWRKKKAHTSTWLFGNEVNSVTLYYDGIWNFRWIANIIYIWFLFERPVKLYIIIRTIKLIQVHRAVNAKIVTKLYDEIVNRLNFETMVTITYLDKNSIFLPEMIVWLLFSKPELKFSNVEINFQNSLLLPQQSKFNVTTRIVPDFSLWRTLDFRSLQVLIRLFHNIML